MSAPISAGEQFVVIVPIAISEDLEWPIGTVVECSHVYSVDGEFVGCELCSNDVDASFAAIDLFGESRWFDPLANNPYA